MNLDQYRQWHLHFADKSNELPAPLLMGIVNVTPDSFFDGGHHTKPHQAIDHALKLIDQGADILDIGGESSRPGAKPLSAEEELLRVLPVIQAIRSQSDIMISIDTYKPDVMAQSVDAGASMINDIKALPNSSTQQWLAKINLPVCLMHMQNKPLDMQLSPNYPNGLMPSLLDFFKTKINDCLAAGITQENLILDPGFGFGKTVEHNLVLLKNIKEFTAGEFPVLLGVSRKSTLGAVTGCKPEERLSPGIAAAIYAQLHGVGIIRTHDVSETLAAIKIIAAIEQQKETEEIAK